MKKTPIAVIGASYLQQPLIQTIQDMGYSAHVFAWEADDVGEYTADYFYPVSIVEKDAILDICRRIQPAAVCTISSDLAQVTVNYVANALGLPTDPPESILPCSNKYVMRSTLDKAGIPVPGFIRVSSADDICLPESLSFPLIVKPTDRSGSRGVTEVHCAQELHGAVVTAINYSFERAAVIEEFITGAEYSCEAASFEGEHRILAVTKKYTTGAPYFIETGHMQPSDLSCTQLEAVYETIPRVLTALGITNGISHSEFRIGSDGIPRIIEVGARMGGDCIGSHLVRLSTGVDYVKTAVELALGRKPEYTAESAPVCAGVRFIFSQEDIDYLGRLREEHPEAIYEECIFDDAFEHDIVDSSTRYGYFVLTADTPEELRRLLALG